MSGWGEGVRYCRVIAETNEHLLLCEKLIGKIEMVIYIPDYKDLFGNNINKQIYVSRILRENFTVHFFFAFLSHVIWLKP